MGSNGSLRINIGCGGGRIEGFVNCDLYPGSNVDEVFDCQGKWPFPDNSARDIVASHVLEHLPDPRAFFREAWRVLIPNGTVVLRVPYGGHRAAWWDLEHQRPWFAETFTFLQPGYAKAIGNPEHADWTAFFGVEQVDYRVGKFLAPWLRRRWMRKLIVSWISCVPDWCEELFVYVFAIKTEEAQDHFARTRIANVIPCRYIVYRHHMTGRALKPGEPLELLPVAELDVVNGY
ncbi:MAG: class I SAM-dependent methyltransferase [Betaproteobacteria bacterium]|nr:class I SAM-dependent methyltransferase [Betaproteobacteria bacterium]